MMNIVKKYIALNSFEDTRNRYSELPKISFDYEVAEKQNQLPLFLLQENGKILAHGIPLPMSSTNLFLAML